MDIKTELRVGDVISHIIACETLANHYKKEKKNKQYWKYAGKVEGLESAVGAITAKSITQVWDMIAAEKLKRDLTQRKEK